MMPPLGLDQEEKSAGTPRWIEPPGTAPLYGDIVERGAQPPIAEQLVSLRDPLSFAADQYRALRQVVERVHRNAGFQVFGVTSAGPGEGKSITALNLAGALAQTRDNRVLIVDADFRRPRVADYLGLEPLRSPGLAEGIQHPEHDLAQLITRLERFNLSVLPAGVLQTAPYELLNSPRLETLLTDARRRYEYVVIDTPPLVPFPDGRLLGRWIDGYVVIVAAHRTPRTLLAEGLRLLEPAKVIGVVFNGDDRLRSRHYGYDDYYRPDGRDRHRGW